jgi:hypothetical protein
MNAVIRTSFLVIGLGILLLGALFIGVRAVDHRVAIRSAVATMQAESELPGGWRQLLGDSSIIRDPHTSMESLTAYLVENVSTRVTAIGEGSEKYRLFSRNAPDELATALSERIGTTEIDAVRPSAPRPKNETWITLSWQNVSQSHYGWWPGEIRSGTLVAEIAGPRGSAVIPARLDEKPWLHHEPGSVGRSQYMVMYSQGPWGSESEALSSARRSAAQALTAVVEGQVRSMPHGATVPSQAIEAQVEAALARGSGIVDRAVIRVDRPQGQVWYAANLIDTSATTRMPIADSAAQQTTYMRRSFANLILTLGGMLLVLALVYAGLNALTRGYFRGHLRAAVIVMFAVAVAVIVLVMS